MIHSLKLIVILLCIAGTVTEASNDDICDANNLETRLRQQIDTISSYQLTTHVSADAYTAGSEIQGKLPDRLRIEMKMIEPTTNERWIHIYDGENQWAKHHTKNDLTVYRIRLNSVTDSERPFDSGYFLMGSGLLTGEDYPSTLLTLVSIYSMTGQCTPDGAMLRGLLNSERLRNYINSKKHIQDPEEIINRFVKEFPVGTIRFKTDPLSVQGYELGSKDDTNLKVNFDKISLNEIIPPSRFTYQIRSDVEIIDITDQIVNR